MSAAAAALAPLASPARLLASWARQGVESLVAAQKILLDLTAQQVSLGTGMLRERVDFANFHPAVTVAEIAGQGVTSFVGVQKILLDLATGINTLVMNGVKEGLGFPSVVGPVAGIAHGGIQSLIDMQRRFLDIATEETQSAVDAFREGEPVEIRKRTGEIALRSIENFIVTQKEFLDAVSEQLDTVAKPEHNPRKVAAPDRSKILAQLAREGITKFIDAQKGVVDLTLEQFEAGKRHVKAKPAPPRTSFTELTRKSVENFTAAQRALLDVAIKPVEAHHTRDTQKPRKRAKAAKKQHARPVPVPAE